MNQPKPDLAAMRISYEQSALVEAGLHAHPLAQFNSWLHDAIQIGAEKLPEPNAMVLSTATETGEVHSRTVLLKEISELGLVFYTNYHSQKGQDLDQNRSISALFPWYPLQRQIIVTGTVTQVSREQSERYFATRPYKSQLGAHVSEQSRIISDRTVLELEMDSLSAKYPEGSKIPLPENWGGYLIDVATIEFWQGRRSRLHDRIKFLRKEEGGLLDQADAWQVIRLAP